MVTRECWQEAKQAQAAAKAMLHAVLPQPTVTPWSFGIEL